MDIEKIYDCFLNSEGISTDSRTISSGQMFFALSGENFNGNKFALSAHEKGAKFLVVDEQVEIEGAEVILVKDTLQCLQDLAKHHRKVLATPIIAITGSNGKTTTKELCHAVLSTQYNCHYTKGNLNNHIGVPLTLLDLNNKHELAIIEMGANHVNEIYPLCEIANPDYGLITNIGKAHLEGFGSLEGVKKGKGELFDFLKEKEGIIFYNGEDKTLKELVDNYDQAMQYFPTGLTSFNEEENLLSFIWDEQKVFTNLTGDYNLFNVAVAIFIGTYFKVSQENIAAAISEYTPTNNRSQIYNDEGVEYFLDAYNANPTSMHLSIDNFLSIEGESKILILGDMLELGEYSENEHQAIVDKISSLKIDRAFFVGQEFKKSNIDKSGAECFLNVLELKQHLNENPIAKGSKVLLKGSRGIGLEKLLD